MSDSIFGKLLKYSSASFILALASLASADTVLPPPEAFGTLPLETDLETTPDGHWLAWIDHKEAKSRVIIFDLVERKLQRLLAAPERTKLRSLSWNDNETLLIVVSETRESNAAKETSDEYFRILAHDVHGGNGRMLPMDITGFARQTYPPLVHLVRTRTTKPRTIIAATYSHGNQGIPSYLLEIDTATGHGVVIKVGAYFTTNWVVDRDGHPVAREDWDWHKSAYRLYALQPNDHIKEIARTDDTDHPRVQGLTSDGTALVILATNGRPHQAAWELPLDGSPMRLLADDPDADVESVIGDPNTGEIVGVFIGGDNSRGSWIQPQARHRAEVLARSFPGKHLEVRNWTAEGTKVLVKVDTASSPPVYYWVDFTSHRADIAGEEYPALANTALGEAQQIKYKSRDGTMIPAILTRPPGKTGTAVPMVVLPHGGPNFHDVFRFDWLAQFLATRGYAVLQPQFRGSTGYGKAFEEAGYRQWGGLMQDDVTDGVAAMIAQGVADAHRVCIVGASYGGYAALAGAAFTPGVYRCAASINGVSDLPALMRSEVPIYSGTISSAKSYWKERIGAPNDSSLDAKSPINFVKNIDIPILIVYGTGDGVVPNDQSQRMVQALRSAGKKVDVDTLNGEDHWLSSTATRTQVLRTVDSFLKANL